MPKICMLIFRYHPIVGGAERSLRLLSRKLLDRNIEVSVATKREPGLRAKELIDGVPVYRIKAIGRGFKGKFLMLTYTLSIVAFLIRYKNIYDIVHIHGADPYGSIASFIGKLFGKKIILKIATGGEFGDIAGFKTSLCGNLQKRLYKKYVDIFIAITAQIKEELISGGFNTNKIREIPNGVDVDIFKPSSYEEKESLRKKLSLSAKAKIVLSAGRLVKRKGIRELFKGWGKLVDIDENIILLIAGKGDQETELRALARDLRLEKSVFFLGDVTNIKDYFSAADLFVLPSWGEGLSNSLLEAMACGLPVVASDIPGIRELIEQAHCGILVKPKDPEGLKDALRVLSSSSEDVKKKGEAAREFVETNFSIEKIAEKYTLLYSDLIQER